MKKSSWWSITSLSNLQGRIAMLIWYTIKFSVFLMAGYSSHSFFDKLQQLSGWSHHVWQTGQDPRGPNWMCNLKKSGRLAWDVTGENDDQTYIWGNPYFPTTHIFCDNFSGDIPPLAPLLPRQPAWIWCHRSSVGIYMDLAWYELVKYLNLIQYWWSIMGFWGCSIPWEGKTQIDP